MHKHHAYASRISAITHCSSPIMNQPFTHHASHITHHTSRRCSSLACPQPSPSVVARHSSSGVYSSALPRLAPTCTLHACRPHRPLPCPHHAPRPPPSHSPPHSLSPASVSTTRPFVSSLRLQPLSPLSVSALCLRSLSPLSVSARVSTLSPLVSPLCLRSLSVSPRPFVPFRRTWTCTCTHVGPSPSPSL